VGVNVDPLGDRLGRRVFPEAFLALLGLVEPVEPDMLPVVFIDELPVVFIDEPVVVPLIPVVAPPALLCASANVLESAKAVASAIVVSFMSCPSCLLDKRQPHRQFYRSIKFFFKRDAAKLFTSRRA
jgi:hypothetical protein